MLRAVDISSWQAGIDPARLDCDIVIVKATGGCGYTNPYWRQWAGSVLASGKLLGLYHFARERGCAGTARAEAHHFIDAVADLRGCFVPILDWEADALLMPPLWAREWLSTVQRELGATPMFYGYASNIASTDYTAIREWPLWMASYLSRYEGAGWVADPYNSWGTGAWTRMSMYQYTSTGHIGGYDGRLDLSIYYGSKDDWKALEDDMSDAYDYMTEKRDASGRNKKVDMRTRQDWMAAKQEDMQKSIDAIAKKVDKIAKKLDV